MITIDCDFPGGNIVVESVDGDCVTVHQDIRDTTTDWFYWCFRARGAAGRRMSVCFTGSNVIGVRGPAWSRDGGWTWRWLGAESVNGQSFSCDVPPNAQDVRFCFGMPYLERNLKAFLSKHTDNPFLELSELCKTAKGRSAELLRLGRLDGNGGHRVLLTCRHHCCEMMANYALEGIMASVLAEDEVGAWFRGNVELMVIPFVDKDGVEDGDQGKNRSPRDHNRDYSETCVYSTTAAIRDRVPRWAGGKLHLALDLHCPHIRGIHNEDIYFPGGPDPCNWQQVLHFSELLEQVQSGPLVFSAQHNLPFGQDWNVPSNLLQGVNFANWAAQIPGIRMGATLELPYANAGGREVNQQTAFVFGHDLAKAIRAYLLEIV